MTAESRRLLAIIEKQERVVSRGQALSGGLSHHALAHRLRPGGPWRQLLPGVYLTVTGTPTPAQRETAAVLYAGPQSVISGVAALRYHRLPSPAPKTIDVLVPAPVQRCSTGYVLLHRTRRLPALRYGLPCRAYASPARAAADAALWLSDLREVRAVIAGAVQSRGGCTVGELADELRAGPMRNSALLRQVLAEVSDGVRSAPEADFRQLVKTAGLPMPLFNPRLYLPSGVFLGCPDAWWPEAGLAVEVDSRQWHLNPQDWERTMDRHARFGEHAIVTLHFAPRKLRTEPAAVIAQLKNAYRAGTIRPRLPITAIPANPDAKMSVTPSRLSPAECRTHPAGSRRPPA
jgi:hypothetical protein